MVSLDSELRRIHALRLWEERLQASDSVFVRLVFVSQLRDAAGRYADPFLLRVFSARGCHTMVADAHRQVFREWLGMSARLKLRDFKKYRDALCQRTAPSQAVWSTLWSRLVPSGISIAELDLFCETVKRLAEVIGSTAVRAPRRTAIALSSGVIKYERTEQ
jgi:hypothetical protein